MSPNIVKSDQEWKHQLTAEQYHVTRERGTERAFSGKYHDCKQEGTYNCICCGAALFSSKDKFDSGTGWPSFTLPLDDTAVGTLSDRSLFMVRTEVHCSQCEAHLGHVFEDGPIDSGGLRFCINSASLDLAVGDEDIPS